MLENRDPMIIRTLLRSRGTGGFYQVRVGVDTRADANKLCADLTAKGAACMVLRNSRGSPELLQRDGGVAGPDGPGSGAARDIPSNARATR